MCFLAIVSTASESVLAQLGASYLALLGSRKAHPLKIRTILKHMQ